MQINITNGTISTVTQTLTATSGHSLPSKIVASGATASYNSSTGMLTLTNLGEMVYINIPAISSFNELSIEEHTGSNYITLNINDISLNINAVPIITPVNPYLTFSSPNTFTLEVVDHRKYWNGTLEYSTDAENWNTWSGTSAVSSASDGTKHNLYVRGTGNTYITGGNASSSLGAWRLNGSNISVSGNIENLLDYATVALGNHPAMAISCYLNLFAHPSSSPNSSIIDASNLQLPATTLTNYCYADMFQNCTSLTTAPALPATILTDSCYEFMFSGCTSLTTAPELPATTLASTCYQRMFQNCTSLTTAPALPATTLASYCYRHMFSGCTSLTTAPALPATTLASYCYQYMFQNCTSLTTAPALPATTLKSNCYYQMFYNCTSLTTPAKMAGGTTQATAAPNCCYQMYYGCTSLNIYTSSSGHTAFYKAITYSTDSSATNYYSSYRMFRNCKINGTTSTADYLTAGTQYYY